MAARYGKAKHMTKDCPATPADGEPFIFKCCGTQERYCNTCVHVAGLPRLCDGSKIFSKRMSSMTEGTKLFFKRATHDLSLHSRWVLDFACGIGAGVLRIWTERLGWRHGPHKPCRTGAASAADQRSKTQTNIALCLGETRLNSALKGVNARVSTLLRCPLCPAMKNRSRHSTLNSCGERSSQGFCRHHHALSRCPQSGPGRGSKLPEARRPRLSF